MRKIRSNLKLNFGSLGAYGLLTFKLYLHCEIILLFEFRCVACLYHKSEIRACAGTWVGFIYIPPPQMYTISSLALNMCAMQHVY